MPRRKPLIFFLLSIALVFAPALIGQQAGAGIAVSQHRFPAITLKAAVHEVSLVFSVTDRKGHFVRELQPSDLRILDNNQQQTTFTFFQSQTDMPLRIALLLDVSSSVGAAFETEQDTIHGFLKDIVRPNDTAALFAFNQRVQLIAPVAENWKKIRHQIKHLKITGETAIYDAVSSASAWLIQDPRPARRIIILITDGQENESHTSRQESISSALKAEASIYSVNVGHDNPEISKEAREGKETLKQLADQTGGNYLEVKRNGNAERAFNKIRRELRNQYAIAYRPSNLAPRSFHQLVVLGPHNLRVRCRSGYYVK